MNVKARTAEESPPTAELTRRCFVGRQAIFDRSGKVTAYELLFRSGETNRAMIVDSDMATAQVLTNTFMELGIDTVVGDKRAFVNFSRGLLTSQDTSVLPPSRVCIEVLENVNADPELVAGLRRFKKLGYTVALDDFTYRPSLEPLVELADIVKIDVLRLNQEEIEEQISLLGSYDVELLAEKVETEEELRWCIDKGFAYFQGYFLERPRVIQGESTLPDQLGMMQLLAQVNAPMIVMDELEATITRDVSLSYRLLQFINSALFSPDTPSSRFTTRSSCSVPVRYGDGPTSSCSPESPANPASCSSNRSSARGCARRSQRS